MAQLKMCRVVTAADAFEARVIAARLGAEGIVWELRGSVDGPLALGTVDVLVTEGDYDAARDVLLAEVVGTDDCHDDAHDHADVDFDDEVDDTGPDGSAPGRVERWVLAAVVVVAVVAFALVRMGARV